MTLNEMMMYGATLDELLAKAGVDPSELADDMEEA